VGVLDIAVRDAQLIEPCRPLLDLLAAGQSEGDVVKADAVLSERLDRRGGLVLVQPDRTTCINPPFAWNHGDIPPEIANTWLGLAGPGIRNLGETSSVWTDHTDVRPTILTLLGLRDTYLGDGRAILEVLQPGAVPATVQAHRETLLRLGAAYKQLNAPFGDLGRASLMISTRALTGGSPTDDSAYTATQAQLTGWANERDQIAGAIAQLLSDAQSGDHAVDEGQAKALIAQADALVGQVQAASQR
jgi:hypothetical protein